MAYTPSLHASTPKPLGVSAAVPTDARSYYYDTALFKYRPYQSIAEVLGYLTASNMRTGMFPIYINSEGTLNGSGDFVGGSVTHYWFKKGTADADLQRFTSPVMGSGHISAEELGVVMNDNTVDNGAIINDILDSEKNLLLPPGDIYCSTPIVCPSEVNILGSGKFITRFVFPGTGVGFHIPGYNGTYKDFQIRGSLGTVSDGFNSSSAHAAWIQGAQNYFHNMGFYCFDGTGIRVQGDVGGGTNANLNLFIFCESNCNGNAGLHTSGGDSNACLFIMPSFIGNAQYGIKLDDFLQTTILAPHIASNIINHNFHKGLVLHGGVYYWTLANSLGVEPGVTSGWQNYWLPHVDFSPPFTNIWAADVQYYDSGSLVISNPNSMSTITGIYLEGDQPPPRPNGRSRFDGGQGGADISGAIWNRNGLLSVLNMQARNKDTGVSVRMDSATAGIGWHDDILGTWMLEGNINQQRLCQNGSNNSDFSFYSPWWPTPGRFGRTVMPSLGTTSINNLFFPVGNNVNDQVGVTFGTAAPVSGEWEVGHRHYHKNPVVSGIDYWLCTVGGTPGTWVPVYTNLTPPT